MAAISAIVLAIKILKKISICIPKDRLTVILFYVATI